MTVDAQFLKDLLDFNFSYALDHMAKGKTLAPMATLIPENGGEFLVFQNSAGLSAAQMKFAISTKVKEGNIQAVAFLGEAHFTQITHPEAMAAFDRGERCTGEEAMAKGWGTRRETLICSVETKTALHIVYQFYHRDEAGNLVLEDIKQERDITPEDFSKRTGIFCFFDHAGMER
jgi:hypothetical protein